MDGVGRVAFFVQLEILNHGGPRFHRIFVEILLIDPFLWMVVDRYLGVYLHFKESYIEVVRELIVILITVKAFVLLCFWFFTFIIINYFFLQFFFVTQTYLIDGNRVADLLLQSELENILLILTGLIACSRWALYLWILTVRVLSNKFAK